ncbi:hypothetical protein L208DRAFT_1279827, partial [Tricholoma matsutake]
GLGRDWGNCFITKHHNRLGMYWSSALDGSCGRAVNPTIHSASWSMHGTTTSSCCAILHIPLMYIKGLMS